MVESSLAIPTWWGVLRPSGHSFGTYKPWLDARTVEPPQAVIPADLLIPMCVLSDIASVAFR